MTLAALLSATRMSPPAVIATPAGPENSPPSEIASCAPVKGSTLTTPTPPLNAPTITMSPGLRLCAVEGRRIEKASSRIAVPRKILLNVFIHIEAFLSILEGLPLPLVVCEQLLVHGSHDGSGISENGQGLFSARSVIPPGLQVFTGHGDH